MSGVDGRVCCGVQHAEAVGVQRHQCWPAPCLPAPATTLGITLLAVRNFTRVASPKAVTPLPPVAASPRRCGCGDRQPQDRGRGALDLPGPLGRQAGQGQEGGHPVHYQGQAGDRHRVGSLAHVLEGRCQLSVQMPASVPDAPPYLDIPVPHALHALQVFDQVVVQPRDAREASDVFYRQVLT